MTIIGVILLLIAVLLLLGAIFGGSDSEVQLDLGVVELSMSVLSVFLVGAASVLLIVGGLELLRSGTRRSLRRRRELKHARSVVADHERRQPTQGRADTAKPAPGEAAQTRGESKTIDPDSATPGARDREATSGPPADSDPDAGPRPDTTRDTDR